MGGCVPDWPKAGTEVGDAYYMFLLQLSRHAVPCFAERWTLGTAHPALNPLPRDLLVAGELHTRWTGSRGELLSFTFFLFGARAWDTHDS